MDEEAVLREFGERVRKAREKAGLTQEQLAFEAELDRTFINRVENGRRNPSLVSILRIARGLGVPPRSLLPREL